MDSLFVTSTNGINDWFIYILLRFANLRYTLSVRSAPYNWLTLPRANRQVSVLLTTRDYLYPTSFTIYTVCKYQLYADQLQLNNVQHNCTITQYLHKNPNPTLTAYTNICANKHKLFLLASSDAFIALLFLDQSRWYPQPYSYRITYCYYINPNSS